MSRRGENDKACAVWGELVSLIIYMYVLVLNERICRLLDSESASFRSLLSRVCSTVGLASLGKNLCRYNSTNVMVFPFYFVRIK